MRGAIGPGYPILFHDDEDGYDPSYIMASDLEHFIKFSVEMEVKFAASAPYCESNRWPFDKEGVARRDPAKLEFTGVPLP